VAAKPLTNTEHVLMRAMQADTPRSVGGRFADRVTPSPTPIGTSVKISQRAGV
jgi:hypothetical protein